MQRFIGCSVLCFALNISASLQTSDLESLGSPAVVKMTCKYKDDSISRVSLGGLLASTGASSADIVLVAAHGLYPDTTRCSISLGTEKLEIKHVSKGTGANVYADWAVLTLDGRFSGSAPRLDWASFRTRDFRDLIENDGAIFLAKHPNGELGRGCRVHVPRKGLRDTTDADAVLVSDCRTMPGMSGAPAIAKVDGVPAMVGLSIGTRYDLSDGELEWGRRVNVIRLIDDRIELAIAQAIAQQLK